MGLPWVDKPALAERPSYFASLPNQTNCSSWMRELAKLGCCAFLPNPRVQSPTYSRIQADSVKNAHVSSREDMTGEGEYLSVQPNLGPTPLAHRL